MKIYVGEDSPIEQKLLKALLDNEGEVRFFADGLELYRAITVSPPDLVITDILMPRLHGLALCRLLRQSLDYESIKILCISSITDATIEQRSVAAGADLFVPKPLNVGKFERALRTLINNIAPDRALVNGR